MKSGFFWDFFQYNEKAPIIEKKEVCPCNMDSFLDNNAYLFQVSYYKNRINVEVQHTLTDGNNGMIFFKEIIYNYLDLNYDLKENRNDLKIEKKEHIEDGYLAHYKKIREKVIKKSKKAFLIKGTELPLHQFSKTHFIMDLKQLKIVVKEYNSTLTEFLTAGLIYTIYQSVYDETSNKPVQICIPINLNSYFSSKTMANFFSYTKIGGSILKSMQDDFSKILSNVKKEFQIKLKRKEVEEEMSSNVRLGQNFFIHWVPLPIKKGIIRLFNQFFKGYSSTTLTNIGKIDILPIYQQYIDKFLVMMSLDDTEKIKATVCSYQNFFIFTFNSILESNLIEKEFYNFLKNRKIDVFILK